MTGAYGDPPPSGAYAAGSHPAPYPGSAGPTTGYPGSPPPGEQYATPGAAAHPDVADVSVGDLIGNVTRDLSTLMRQELALALVQHHHRRGFHTRDKPSRTPTAKRSQPLEWTRSWLLGPCGHRDGALADHPACMD